MSKEFIARFSGTPGMAYTIECKESLLPANWQVFANVIAPTNDLGWDVGVFALRDAIHPDGHRFYRVVYPPN